MIPVYNERAGVEYRVHLFDEFNLPAIPETVHWRLDCETTGTQLADWTLVTPETVARVGGGYKEVYVDIEIAGPLNAIQKDRNKRELKKLWVVCNKDQAREFNRDTQYEIRNLRGRT
jgi:hypothetical protein